MKRFRFTLLAICLVLLYLGWTDASLFLRNPSPQVVSIEELERQGASREWLDIRGGFADLKQAISTSGSVELDALLVPLKSHPDQEGFKVLVETRDPRLMEPFKTYHFKIDTVFEKETFLAENLDKFTQKWSPSGTLIEGIIASGNRDKLMELAQQLGMQVPEDVIFLSEGKQPASVRGFLFIGVAVLGLAKLIFRWKTPKSSEQ